MTSRLAAIVLAAGLSRRFGRPKQLVSVAGQPMALRAVDTALEAAFDEVVVVVPASLGPLAEALRDTPAHTVLHPEPEKGLASSIRQGLDAISGPVAAALFLPADLPHLRVSTMTRLATAFREGASGHPPIVVPTARGRRAAPVTFPADLFPELSALSGDQGGRTLLERHGERILEVEVADPRELDDVDLPEDLATLPR